MENFLWFLLTYLFGVVSGAALLISLAFWDDFKHWVSDIVWKIKLWRMR